MSADGRVELRVPAEEDAATWTALFDDDEVMRFIGNGERRDHAYYVRLVEEQRQLATATGLCLFSVVAEQRVVGFAGVHPWSQPWGPVGEPEIGWRLGRDFWGRGYATCAAAVVVARARDSGLPRLLALIQEGNAPSFAVARRIGMTPVTVLLSPEGTRVHQLGLSLPA